MTPKCTYVMTFSRLFFLMFSRALLAKPEASIAKTCFAPALAANTYISPATVDDRKTNLREYQFHIPHPTPSRP